MNNYLSQSVYWTELHHQEWQLYLAATSKGLCYVSSNSAPFEELASWAARRMPHASLIQADDQLHLYGKEIAEYLEGRRDQFTISFDLQGTAFQLEVWHALLKIPYGTTCSYSDVAERIGKPSASRAVGTAIGANPLLIRVPCHRVIGKNGALTGYRGGIDMKTSLLRLEQEGTLHDAG
ncbi:Methylated-DNA--protein-cysteine methyltransferase, inducible [compost metagenome]